MAPVTRVSVVPSRSDPIGAADECPPAGRPRRTLLGRTVRCGLIWLVTCGVFSCHGDDPYDRVGFQGTVTLDGEPLKAGFVTLEPKEKQPTQAFAYVADGHFEVDAENGAVPGLYRVAITIDDTAPAAGGATVRQLPDRYNLKSELDANLEADGANQFSFVLFSSEPKSASSK